MKTTVQLREEIPASSSSSSSSSAFFLLCSSSFNPPSDRSHPLIEIDSPISIHARPPKFGFCNGSDDIFLFAAYFFLDEVNLLNPRSLIRRIIHDFASENLEVVVVFLPFSSRFMIVISAGYMLTNTMLNTAMDFVLSMRLILKT